MKYCEHYASLISAFADDEVTEQERSQVLAHLESCEGCRAYLEELMTLSSHLASDVPPVPADFADSVMSRVRQEKRKKPRRSIYRTATAAAACLVLVLALRLILSGGLGQFSASSDCATSESSSGSDPGLTMDPTDEADDALLDGGDSNSGMVDADREEATESGTIDQLPCIVLQGSDTAAAKDYFAANGYTAKIDPLTGKYFYLLQSEDHDAFRSAMHDSTADLSALDGVDPCQVFLSDDNE